MLKLREHLREDLSTLYIVGMYRNNEKENSLLLIQEVIRIQDRQCTYNVTMRRVRATVVAVERQYVLLILSVCL